ncbi:MAG: putative Phage replication protein [Verrucomicrobiaceae bacterium]|nr:putative Phage replication protein [Verrucomicrobiaceae bacterium]
MVDYLSARLGVELPPAHLWIVSRIDVTGNLELGSLAEVRQSLAILRNIEGGRYRVSQQAGDTVYWSHLSKMRSGKAYAKGPHLRHLMKNPKYTGCSYSAQDIEHADRLLRLELKIGREWFSRNNWRELSPSSIRDEWEKYFGRMIGGAEMVTDDDIQKRVMACAKTEGQGRAAFGCWVMIKAEGWERARGFFAKTSWYRHLEILRAAGLRDADISAGQVVPLRRRILEAQMVTTWDQLRAA